MLRKCNVLLCLAHYLEEACALNPYLSHLRAWLRRLPGLPRHVSSAPLTKELELPLRAELFSALQMEQHGRILANAHTLGTGSGQDHLLMRLAENEKTIIHACSQLTEAIQAGRQITPAGAWLLDNFYLIEEQIHTAKRHLPPNYSQQLPRLLHGTSAGQTRVYDIARETVAHGDGRVDPEVLSRFVAAYQQVTSLKLGELWAIPIMLRIALIENLRRVAVQLSLARSNRNLACEWAEKMLASAEQEPGNLILLIADMARSNPPLDSSFVAEMVRLLQGQSPNLMLPLNWLAQHLALNAQTIEQLVQIESQQQAADQLSISNSIGSLRFLSSMDWRVFVETMSVVEHHLRKDPAAVYSSMDFATRDQYRHVVEKLARHSKFGEAKVAACALQLAQEQSADTNMAVDCQTCPATDGRRQHIGYYLIGNGRPQLEQMVGFTLPFFPSLLRSGRHIPLRLYLGSIFLLCLASSTALLAHAYANDVAWQYFPLLALLSLFASSETALAMVNWCATLLVPPRPLPRMNFTAGLPASARSIVVVPCMLLNANNVEQLCIALEVRFLANRDPHLHFCLLSDFADASSETMPSDAALLAQIEQKICLLNDKYRSIEDERDHFLLLHRPRRWNAQEKVWMAYERKRGKLSDLNAFLRGAGPAAFSLIVGSTADLQSIKYVITLDTDTELPRDTARQFIAAMSHPLNRPLYDVKRQRVCQGYGILQPRVAVSLPAAHASRYTLLCGGEVGIDPYTRTVSDVYQDIFGEGSFIGKGIYDIDAFEQALHQRLPENRILSHDLLEGCYTRAGLLSDVQLYEAAPANYGADVKRRHRWVRGDWQIAAWLMAGVPFAAANSTAKSQINPLSALSRWKLFDNLRRSLVSAALVSMFLISWSLLPQPAVWTLAILLMLSLHPLALFMHGLTRKAKGVRLHQHLHAVLRSGKQNLLMATLNLSCLPYEAWLNLDAILRTMWRMGISHQQLLEWQPSEATQNGNGTNSLRAYCRRMWFGPVLALASALLLMYINVYALQFATPILFLWLVSPLLAGWISQPIRRRGAQLSAPQTLFLHALARKTWHFFETYVGPSDNWLPPDNMQEEPVSVVAHRTSPTNIGLSLLANLVAHDFAYITTGDLLQRTQHTLHSMSLLERFQGHFYNWYDTQNLTPLQPRYVSTVDSGNLAGHLLTLAPGLRNLLEQSIVGPHMFEGLRATCEVLRNHADAATLDKMSAFERNLEIACQSRPTTLSLTRACLYQLQHDAACLVAHLLSHAPNSFGLQIWSSALEKQIQQALQELDLLAPWVQMLSSATWLNDLPELDQIPTLSQLARLHADLATAMARQVAADDSKAAHLSKLRLLLAEGSQAGAQRIQLIQRLALQAHEFSRMEYGFLYDASTHLLAIGYNSVERRRDVSCYDLLASEARLTTFVGIAQGELPQESWFALGRQLTIASDEPILLSWSGSMFEYLMPLLVMPTFDNTLLDQTYRSAVARQIEYGVERGVPWGISESGYQAFDTSLNYQYRAFGVPGLGFKRGLGDDLVIAPYASMMALMVAPEAACSNLQLLSSLGFEGHYGFYEAIDYTSTRLPRGRNYSVVRSFMSHHQGMGLLSLAYLLLDQPMQKRFISDPLCQATMLLLHERVPQASASYSNTSELADIRSTAQEQVLPMRILQRPDPRTPEVQLLSNGRYHLMVTSGGGSASRWQNTAITRWCEDSTRDHWGTFCYIREVEDGSFWSTTFQPTLAVPKHYEVIFSEGRAEFRRHDNQFEMHTEILVSPEDDVELRRSKIVNRGRSRKTIDITSYAEVVLSSAAADNMHPAFSKLFVQTEILPACKAILCSRRPRSQDEKTPWMFHLLALHGAQAEAVSFETDRMQFIGRGNSLIAPRAMLERGALSGSQGSVLDPIVAIRYQITLEPEQIAIIDMVSGIAETRSLCMDLVDKYQDRHLAERVIELSWTHSQVVLRQLNASEADAQLYGRLANSIMYVNPYARAKASVLQRNHRGQSALWSHSISGDLPIVLLQIRHQENIELVRQMVQAHAYWHAKGLAVDLEIWNEDHASYRQALQEQIMGLISSLTGSTMINRPGGIFVRMLDQISEEDRILFQSVARIILSDSHGTLAEQLNRRGLPEVRPPALIPVTRAALPASYRNPVRPVPLQLGNGTGGFSADGREYVIRTNGKQVTPTPWVNVLANAYFGSVISESGQAYTWGENAHEFRLTPWANDPVCDGSGEAFYLRDEETGQYWSPTPLPRRGSGDYVCRHGFGYSVFSHSEDGISSELTVFVALDAAIKYAVLKVRNESSSTRKLSATGYVEWVLGDLPAKTAMHIVTEIDAVSGSILARNPYNTEFTQRTAFFDVDTNARSITCDRNEFIGRNGSLHAPAALRRQRLSGKIGAGLDPCSALQVAFELAPNQERELVFMLGMADTRHTNLSQLILRYRGAQAAQENLNAVHDYWQECLGAVQVQTPDPALNVLSNGWLIYQTLACRLWARSGYYQSGGAFGFRDQLQDCMALLYSQPQLVRQHLLRAAQHQFVEGDVQHWWHPPAGRGVRTHCSDDYLWLPLVVERYLCVTGDHGILQEEISFLEGRSLLPEEDSYYDMPQSSHQSASLYQHCVRAIEHGLRFGVHGLALIGSCDWNDGMDKVGSQGQGESVWLSFFLYDVLLRFAVVAETMQDLPFAFRCRAEAVVLKNKIEEHAWDGDWYLRAFFDDGTPLGSHHNAECQIDSISQSWSVLSTAGEAARSRSAMQAVYQRLVNREAQLVQLLDPPFDKSTQNPGYIRGYVPGVRENGGQYTHAAIWAAMAFAKQGEASQAWELLRMINPIYHSNSPVANVRYKVEPYVVAADVYAMPPHTGRGGWTWYTGSSAWLYRLILESLLGLRVEQGYLLLSPCLPAEWDSYSMRYRHRSSVYQIEVKQNTGAYTHLSLDGVLQADGKIALQDDGLEHQVHLQLS